MSHTRAVKAMAMAGVLIIAKQCGAVSFGESINSGAGWVGGGHKWCNNKLGGSELQLAQKGSGEACRQMCLNTAGCVCAQWNSNTHQCWARSGTAGLAGLQDRGGSFL